MLPDAISCAGRPSVCMTTYVIHIHWTEQIGKVFNNHVDLKA
jgi:hypothetical protein